MKFKLEMRGRRSRRAYNLCQVWLGEIAHVLGIWIASLASRPLWGFPPFPPAPCPAVKGRAGLETSTFLRKRETPARKTAGGGDLEGLERAKLEILGEGKTRVCGRRPDWEAREEL